MIFKKTFLIFSCLAFFVFMTAYAADDNNKTSLSSDLSKLDFDSLKLPYYTGNIFPHPQNAIYRDKFIPLHDISIVLGPNVSKNDLRLQVLTKKLQIWGTKLEISSKISEKPVQILLDFPEYGVKAPDKPEGYSINCFKRDGIDFIALNSHDKQGLLWGIVSILQLTRHDDITPSSKQKDNNGFFDRISASIGLSEEYIPNPAMRSAEITDFPDYSVRGFLATGLFDYSFEMMLFSKMNTIFYQYNTFGKGRNAPWWREAKGIDDTPKLHGKIFNALGLDCYYTIHPVADDGNGYGLSCASESDRNILIKHAMEMAANHVNLYFAFDDTRFPLQKLDKEKFGTAAKADPYINNLIYTEVKKKYPEFKMIFCPPFYFGPEGTHGYPENREEYLKALGENLDKNIEVFWTGPFVKSREITKEQSEWMTKLIKRKPTIFQNRKGLPHLHGYCYITDPVYAWTKWHYNGFFDDMHAYIINSMVPSDSMSNATLGDCLWNLKAYNPEESVRNAVGCFFGKDAFPIFDDFNKKLSYFDPYEYRVSPYAASKLEEIEVHLKELEEAYAKAQAYNPHSLKTLSGMNTDAAKWFVHQLKNNPSLKRFAEIDKAIKGDAVKEVGLTDKDIFIPPSMFGRATGYEYYANKCPKRFAVWIYGKQTSSTQMITSFECDPFPPEGDYELIICGQDSGAPRPSNITIYINNKPIFEGPSGFAQNDWSIKKFRIKMDLMVRNNELKIVNNCDGAIGAPWFMLNYAVLKKLHGSK